MLWDGTNIIAKGRKPEFADIWVHGVDVQLGGEVKDGGGNVRISGSSGSHIHSPTFAVAGFLFGELGLTFAVANNPTPNVLGHDQHAALFKMTG
jgi:hypothetical protein